MSKRQAESISARERAPKKPKVTEAADVSNVDFVTPTTPTTDPEAPERPKSDAVTPVTPNVVDPSESMDVNGPTESIAHKDTIANASENDAAPEEQDDAIENKSEKNTTLPKAAKNWKFPPVKDAFNDWEPSITLPPHNVFWGIKPLPGSARPDPVQPSARDSNGDTNPPMWEKRGYRFKRGSQHVKYFGPLPPHDVADLTDDLDQEDILVVRLLDMRPMSRKDPTPKRTPTTYHYDGGKPKDWNNMQAVKCLNDRRAQAIDRITMDAPWTRVEREFLASLLKESPDASIWELTERHNERFMGQDFAASIGWGYISQSEGRTVESIAHEYRTYKPLYDQGLAPDFVRFRNDNSREGKEIRASKRMQSKFGKASKALELKWDAEHADDQDGDQEPDEEDPVDGDEDGTTVVQPKNKSSKVAKKAASKKAASKKVASRKVAKNSASVVDDSDNEGEMPAAPTTSFADQARLDENDEALLEMAGAYDSDKESCTVSERQPSASPSLQGESPSAESRSRLPSLVPEDIDSSDDPDVAWVINEILGEIIDDTVSFKESHSTVDCTPAAVPAALVEEVTIATTVEVNSEIVTLQADGTQTHEGTRIPAPQISGAKKIFLDEDYDDDEEL